MTYKDNKLIVADTGWAETIPDWLLNEVKNERMTLGLSNIIDDSIYCVGNAEVCIYLYTLSLRQPLRHEYAEIYMFLASTLMKKRGVILANFMEEKLSRGLSKDESRQLEDLRNTIGRIRGEIQHPVLDALRLMKKCIEHQAKTEDNTLPQLTIF